MNDIIAMLVIEFDDTVDRVSRAMFAERMAENGWVRDERVPSVWTAEFEPRSRLTMRQSTRNWIELAASYARIEMTQLRAIAHYGEEEPLRL
jgi:hypothetical protein